MSKQTMIPSVTIRNQTIEVANGNLVSLTDIWTAAAGGKNQRPHEWGKLPSTQSLLEAALKSITGKSRNSFTKAERLLVWRTERGRDGRTYGDVRLAVAYAEYLNPAIAIEVKQVFLRFKSADPTMADDILQRSSPGDNEWVAKRAMSRVVRSGYTRELDSRGVKESHEFAQCTNVTYQKLFDADARALRKSRGLPEKANIRNSLSSGELAFVAAAEALSIERMCDEESEGLLECRNATSKAAGAIRSAIDTDRKSRTKRLV